MTGFLQGGGQMGVLMRRRDWSASALGEPENWPAGLRSAVGICLGSPFPIAISWGPELALLYNDAWASTLGAQYFSVLGQPAPEALAPLFEHVRTTGEALRSGDYAFSPIRGDGGQVEGVFQAVIETTREVRAEAVGLLESITDGLFRLDRNWCFTYVNAACERMLQMPRETLLGRDHWKLFPASVGSIADREYHRAVREKVPVELEFFYERLEVWYFVKAYPTDDGGVAVYFRDITGQRSAEARLRAIYDGTYEYVGLLSPDGTLLEANRASLEFGHNQREDVVGRKFWDTVWFTSTPGAPELVRDSVMRAASGEFVRFDASVRRPSGEWMEFDISFHPVRNDAGEVVLIVPEGRNITGEKVIREQLRQQWHIFDTALSNTPDATYVISREGRFVYANRALLARLDRSFDEVTGKNFFELGYPQALAERVHREIEELLETRQPVRGETSLTTRVAGTRQYEYIFVPVLGTDGEVEAIAGSTRDVTELKQAEELERERQVRLRESARLESLGVMAGGIAHDFNNLLVGILGNASLLTETDDRGDREIAGEIVAAAERAAQLTGQMLAYSGRGRFVTEVLDLNALIQENLALMRASVSRNISVKFDLNCDSCVVECDRSQIHQVLMNLLINASEASGDEPGKVVVRTGAVERHEARLSPHLLSPVVAGSYALLEVEDNGVGMPSETVKKIFDPFFTTKFPGRGMGLAAVMGIVKGHKGDIEVESTPGAGTVFRIFLPLSERARERGPRSDANVARPPEQTVLLVDDEVIVRRMASMALERGGFRVLLAANGEEALSVLAAEPHVSAVILDLTMPVMTGEQALPVIRQKYPSIPIILSSGFKESEIAHRFAAYRIAGVLQKPYTVSGIIAKVTQAIEKARPASRGTGVG